MELGRKLNTCVHTLLFIEEMPPYSFQSEAFAHPMNTDTTLYLFAHEINLYIYLTAFFPLSQQVHILQFFRLDILDD